jgi:hypothetical protein
MAHRDILGEYGPESPRHHAPVARSGGIKEAKSLKYDHPHGPEHQSHQGPGIKGGTVHPCGTQKCYD